jgi:glycosyltransferase involved in cell wall biosynthesis
MPEFEFTVSIRLMVYNQESFIDETMRSILAQKTNFKVELVVGDDFSKDKTLEILKSYKDTENIHIKILDRKINDEYWKKRQAFGRLYNFINIIENCSGKYIALLDGDDYWTDEKKLQKQVDLLEKNKSLSASCHNLVTLYTETGKLFNRFSDKNRPKDEITLVDMLKGNWASTPTIMVRSEIIKSAPEWIFSERVADYFLWCYASTIGNIGYLHEPMAVYRVHNEGVWSKNSAVKRIILETDNILRANKRFCTDEKTKKENIIKLNHALIKNLEEEGFRKEAFKRRMSHGFHFLIRGKFGKANDFFFK